MCRNHYRVSLFGSVENLEDEFGTAVAQFLIIEFSGAAEVDAAFEGDDVSKDFFVPTCSRSVAGLLARVHIIRQLVAATARAASVSGFGSRSESLVQESPRGQSGASSWILPGTLTTR